MGGFSSLQTPPHSLTGFSPLTHFHGSLGSSHLSTPARSMPSGSLQVTMIIENTLTCNDTFMARTPNNTDEGICVGQATSTRGGFCRAHSEAGEPSDMSEADP